ncbi:uncharacterized protein C8A04DRAFT_36929 [Dichotomopilus funicola]|uniref:Myb-like DNA-binding domain-containing protein n=1 Tax=Dichotomopilus funicola TaxID=1934379 RepID=A0AAN6V3A1_9PEZI|nr:hypothetical protein C8A04DRAFT_36929 [Dichotomopilus funicola]
MSNNDNVMARFLFAILQQKCLKDIDWNKVAHNPVLAQEITNGHAARMRYSRFRAAMLGLEPQRRNRTNANKNRVSKKKKDDKPRPKKDDEDEEGRASGSGIGNIKAEKAPDPGIKVEKKSISHIPTKPFRHPASVASPAMVKPEPGLVNLFNHLQQPSALSTTSAHIKQENIPITNTPSTTIHTTSAMPEPAPFGVHNATPSTSPSMTSTPYDNRMQMRLLTPCSDSDGTLTTMQGFISHSPPPPDMLHSSQHHSHPHHHLAGAGSPPLSAAAPSPYDFSQHQLLCDTTAAGSSSPWHSQQHLHHHHSSHAHHDSQPQTQGLSAMFSPTPTFSFTGGIFGLEGGFANTGNNGTNNNNNNNPFCGSDHHFQTQPRPHQNQHHHHHSVSDKDGHHIIDDPLGLQLGMGIDATPSLFREKELELEMSRNGTRNGNSTGDNVNANGLARGGWDGERLGI